MKASYQWLKTWVEFDASPEELATRLTLGGLEVDECSVMSAGLEGVVVAEIESAEPHPDADRLRVCQVKGDVSPRTIVCGAPNAHAGLKAPLATLGATLPNGITIKQAKLRGVVSEGMLCSASELGLGEGEHAAAGLWALPEDAPVGQSLIDYLGLDDVVLDVDLTPNRADCLSIRGLAREIAALLGGTLTPIEINAVPATIEDSIFSSVSTPKDCPMYLTRVIRGIDPQATSPLWLRERLRRCGVRPISATVDVTNYVLLELGQPMHAFDRGKLGDEIQVRRATEGEALTLLDGQTITLDAECLIIADENKPLALAGVMGGLDSAVDVTTTDLVLESAWFDPAVVMGRARRFGLHTESSHRFERGVDPDLQRDALERATELLLDIVGGNAGPILETSSQAHLEASAPIALEVTHVNRVLGTQLSAQAIDHALSSLGMAVSPGDQGVLSVMAPSARRDISQPIDLIEEVARLVGYDALPSTPPAGALKLATLSESHLDEQRLRHSLASRGFQQVMGWSFIAKHQTHPDGRPLEGLALANPLSQDQGLMRPTLLPGLLEIAERNISRGQTALRLFEVGRVYGPDQESTHLGLLMLGRFWPEHFDGDDRALDLFDLKGELCHLSESHQLGELSFEPDTQKAWMHPMQCAAIKRDGKTIGWLGQVHPQITERFDLPKHTLACEIDLGTFLTRAVPKHQVFSKFPSSRRDLALLLPEDVLAGDVVEAARSAGGERLSKVVVFDLYQGQGVEKGFKSLGIGLIIRDNSRTLTDQDVDAVTASVMAELTATFQARLRG